MAIAPPPGVERRRKGEGGSARKLHKSRGKQKKNSNTAREIKDFRRTISPNAVGRESVAPNARCIKHRETFKTWFGVDLHTYSAVNNRQGPASSYLLFSLFLLSLHPFIPISPTFVPLFYLNCIGYKSPWLCLSWGEGNKKIACKDIGKKFLDFPSNHLEIIRPRLI